MLFARALAVLVSSASILAGGGVSAQNYPVRPVTMICPFPPGGATDAISRIIQDALAFNLYRASGKERLAQQQYSLIDAIRPEV